MGKVLFLVVLFLFSAGVLAEELGQYAPDERMAEHYGVIDQTLSEKEEEVVVQISEAQVSDGGAVRYEDLPSEEQSFGFSPLSKVRYGSAQGNAVEAKRSPQMEELFASLRVQQAELDELLVEFEEIEGRSEELEHELEGARESLRQVRTEKLLASIKADQLRERLAGEGEVLRVADEESSVGDQGLEDGLEDYDEALIEDWDSTRYGFQKSVVHPVVERRQVNDEGLFGDDRVHAGMPLAQLIQPAVPFRAGPGPRFEPLFRAGKGEQVAIEKRYENWFRVIHESGVRGWVTDRDILFGRNSRALPGKLIRIRAYDIETDRTDWERAS
ncbi:SH3 domain-containing protein [bacterium]|nr:SH3 domain-containing protein [bacterium]